MNDSNLPCSELGQRLSEGSGILELMDDLGSALAQGAADQVMMGGGNPAHIPAVEDVWRARLQEILATPGAMEHMLGDYDTPQGRAGFLSAIADYFKDEHGWPIGPEHVAITSGSQTACFSLFNLLAGQHSDGVRRICFPMVPEYIGYADQMLADDALTAGLPTICETAPNRFRYQIDFAAVPQGPDVAAWCLSRPTNPTARLASDAEVEQLRVMARDSGRYLILDNAYGLPFPGVVFEACQVPQWGPELISIHSLSKLGLPTTRTGIVIADPKIIRRLTAMNAVIGLANGSIGQDLVVELLRQRQLRQLCETVIQPFYRQRCDEALSYLDEALAGSNYAIHEPGGAFFLWLWLKELTIDDRTLYQRLKERGVLVVPGSYFFPGCAAEWPHRQQCLRLSYCQPSEQIARGAAIIAEEVRRAS